MFYKSLVNGYLWIKDNEKSFVFSLLQRSENRIALNLNAMSLDKKYFIPILIKIPLQPYAQYDQALPVQTVDLLSKIILEK